MPAWRNWQTHWTQNPAMATSCRFDPGCWYSNNDKVFRPCLFLLWLYTKSGAWKKFTVSKIEDYSEKAEQILYAL